MNKFRLAIVSAPLLLAATLAHADPLTNLHYAPNHNFDQKGDYLPGKVGFNITDITSVDQIKTLPDGVLGLVWVGQCNGADSKFVDTVRPFIGAPKVFGFYLMDEPDPSGKYAAKCSPAQLKAESDWIHAHVPGAKTFIILMNMGSSRAPFFADTYNPANSGIDLFGLNPYPCRTELKGCDFDGIERYVAAAKAWGIPASNIVPVYQAFGGGSWTDDGDGKYELPTPGQAQQILATWGTLVAAPAFDYAYSWGSQKGGGALENSPPLQGVFAVHNKSRSIGRR